MRIGIFGGSFDPPHTGHSRIAVAAREKFNLDKLIMIPTGLPPHKETKTGANHRYNMSALVAKKYGFEISDYEINKKTYCYSYETLEHFKTVYKTDDIYFIVGADSMKNFNKWKNPSRIFELCRVIVASRDDGTRRIVSEAQKTYNTEIYLLDNENINISSTKIRDMIIGEEALGGYVEPKVVRYIAENNLYR